MRRERSPLARELFGLAIRNALLAWEKRLPLCQDTGQMVVWVKLGQEVQIVGGSLEEAVNQGVEDGGRAGHLRQSVVTDPFFRRYAGSYGPAVIHYRITPGDSCQLLVLPNGCGCEQVGIAKHFPPFEERDKVVATVLEQIKAAGSRSCPPTVVGVGIGGNLEQSAYMAKRALLRPIGQPHSHLSDLERRILEEANQLNIGPQGVGGSNSALAVHIVSGPCHRANLPVAVAFNCYLSRRRSLVLQDNEPLPKPNPAVYEKLQELAPTRGWEGIPISTPLTREAAEKLRAGDKVLLSGVIYTARDAAHRQLFEVISQGEELPFNPRGQLLYYVGPAPAPPGEVLGSAGPTTSYRIDPYTPALLKRGLAGTIGKGMRSQEVMEAMREYKAVYLATLGGAGALLSQCIKEAEVIAYPELGPEAIFKLRVEDFPAIVAIDLAGRSLYQ